jgi:hypothetical protein
MRLDFYCAVDFIIRIIEVDKPRISGISPISAKSVGNIQDIVKDKMKNIP